MTRVMADVYCCPYCKYHSARGNQYCRGCGIRFSESDIVFMEANLVNVFGASPWNTRDRYRCLICQAFVCTSDNYCRGCGDEFDDNERHMMRAKLRDLAKNNSWSLLGLMGFVLLVIVILINL